MKDFSSEIDQVLSPQNEQKKSSLDFTSEIDDIVGNNESQLRANLYSAMPISPDTATKQYQVSKQSNIPIEVVRTHENDIKQMTEFNSIDFANLETNFPKLSEQLRDPAKGPAIRDDISKLSYFERLGRDIKQSYQTGKYNTDIGDLGFQQLLADVSGNESLKLTPTQENRLALAEQNQPVDYKLNFISGIPGAVAEMTPLLFDTAKDSIPFAATGVAIGSRGGVPGAITGAGAGFGLGMLANMAKQEAGGAYREFTQFKDIDGKPIDKNVAAGAAVATGLVNGYLENLGFGAISKPFIGAFTRKALIDKVRQGTVNEALKKIGGAVIHAGATEGATEALQELSTVAFGELAKAASTGDYKTLGMKDEKDVDGFLKFLGNAANRIGQSGVRGAQGGIGFGLAGGSFSAAVEAKQNRDNNSQDQTVIADVVKNTKESKTFQRDPKLFEDVTADTLGQEKVYVSAEKVQEYFQSKTPDELNKFFEAIPEAKEQIQEALDVGGNLVLPANKVASALAQGQGLEGLQEFMRLRPEAISDEEFKDVYFNQVLPGMEEQKGKSKTILKSEEIQKNLESQIANAGFTPETSRLYTSALKSFYDAQAQRIGDNKEAKAELDKAFDNLQIQNGEISDQKNDGSTYNQSIRLSGFDLSDREKINLVLKQLDQENKDVDNLFKEHGAGNKLKELTANLPEDYSNLNNKDKFKIIDELAKDNKINLDVFSRETRNVKMSKRYFQKDEKPTFYSALEKSITDLPQGKGSSEQWAGIIKNLNQKGVKQEEIEWSGVQDWLKEQKKNVTKEQVLDYLKANQIKIEEVVKGVNDTKGNLKIQKTEGSFYVYDKPTNKVRARFESEEKAIKYIKEKEGDLGLPKFQKYTLPGGENYRELLMTLPERSTKTWNQENGKYFLNIDDQKTGISITPEDAGLFYLDDNTGRLSVTIPSLKKAKEFAENYIDERSSNKNYRSSHYEVPNILAHIRFNERTDKDGKRVMFIEEVQSDWHQEGKKKGYYANYNKDELAELPKDESIGMDKERFWFIKSPDNVFQISKTKAKTAKEAIDYIVKEKKKSGDVPDAPFKTTWPELAFKRALMWAVENNFDKVAWTTGEQQAERYDLSKQIDRLEYFPSSQTVAAYKNGQEVINKKSSPENLPDMVGKEMADRLLKEPLENGVHQLRGNDLKIGGEGMKGFYDKMLPSMVNKLIKKFGGKVEDTEIGSQSNLKKAVPNQETLDTLREFGQLEKVHSVEITPAMRESIGQGLPLFQGGDNPRGSIQFGLPDGKTIINLFEGRNLSTLLHESGHFFLETQKAIANLPKAPDQIKEDWQKTLEWLGSKDGEITTEMHEKFARGFEAYLYEGKAPSIELRDIFRRFKTWLLRVYKDIKNLNVKVSSEMSAVFDRMLATDEQIDALKSNPIFKTDPKITEMLTSAEKADYIARNEKATQEAKDKLLAKALRQKERENKKFWKEERESIEKEVTKQINQIPVFRAVHFLKTGKFLDKETPSTIKPFKMSEKAIKDRFEFFDNKEMEKLLPNNILSKDGLAPEVVADVFGFSSADEMLQAMADMPDIKTEIKKAVDQEMTNRHGDMLNDGTIEQQALDSMHNQDRGSQIAFELDVINRRIKGIVATKEQFKIKAKEIIGAKKIDDAIKPSQYYLAEVRAAREAGKALGKKDYEAAAKYKRDQLINHYLFQEALKAKKDTAKALKKFSEYQERPKKGNVKIDEDYREKIIEILANYNLAPRLSNQQANRLNGEALVQWMKEMQERDDAVFIEPKEITDTKNKTHYRDLTLDEFRGIYDLVQNIAVQGRDARTIEIEGRKEDLKRIGKELSESIDKNIPESIAKTPRGQKENEALSFAKRFGISLIKARTLIREMDGFKDLGPAHTYLMDQIDSSEIKRVDRLRQSGNDVQAIFEKNYNKKETALSKQKIFIPELGESWTKESIIAAALNYGNKDSRTKLLQGENITPAQMQAVLSNLTEKDWNFVQDVWNYVNTFWPEKAALDKKRYGIAFTKVEPSPFTARTKEGKEINLKGGYYPLKYDYARQIGNEKNFVKEPSIDELFAKSRNYSAQTKRSSSNERINGVRIPVRLTIGPLFEHLNEVITDITMSEAIANSYKILNNRDVRTSLIDKMGNNTYTQLELWLKDLAVGGSRAASAFENALNFLRSGTTISVMGFKVATSLMQITGYTQTFAKLGPKYALKGLGKFLGNGNPFEINKNVHEVFEKSKIMKQRATTFHRDIYEVQKNLQGKSEFKNKFAKAAFWPIVKMQMIVDVPTWLGAYEKGMDQFNDDVKAVKYADTQVIQAQGSGLIKDQSGFERGTVSSETRLSPLIKLWTVFYSYYNTKLNVAYESVNKTDFKKPKDVARMATDMLLLFWVEAVIGEYLIGRAPDFEDDDKDPLWWNIKLALSNIAGTIPGLREIAAGMQGFSSSPASLRGLDELAKVGKTVGTTAVKLSEDEDVDIEKVIQALNSAGGILFKYPSSQINVTLHAMEKANQGDDVKPKDYLIYKK